SRGTLDEEGPLVLPGRAAAAGPRGLARGGVPDGRRRPEVRLVSRPGLPARLLAGVLAGLPGLLDHGAEGREERVLSFVCQPWRDRHLQRRHQALGDEEDHLPGVPALPRVVRLPTTGTPRAEPSARSVLFADPSARIKLHPLAIHCRRGLNYKAPACV